MHYGIVRYFRNQTDAPFIQDPYVHLILEEKGVTPPDGLKRKVGFQELFYDLFVVAALSVYAKDKDLATGKDIASYVVFFAIIWTVWASQTIFDVRYGTRDGLLWIFGYLQLCVFGVFAALSADFDVTLGFHEGEENHARPLSPEQIDKIVNTPQWVRRPDGHLEIESASLRSFKSAAVTYAASRLVLLLQYAIVLYYAKTNRRPTKPVWWHIGGLFLSICMWMCAFATCFSHNESAAIGRLILWIVGLVFEFGSTAVGAAAQPNYRLDLEYWAERFSALTLIVLGEGIIALFESFRSVLQGDAAVALAGNRGYLAGQIFSAVGMYRILYYLYFDQHGHHLKGGHLAHGAWGCMHFPLHLSILLLTQCTSHSIFSSAINLSLDTIFTAFDQTTAALDQVDFSGNMTAVAVALLNSPGAIAVQHVLDANAMDWTRTVGNMITYSAGNTSMIKPLLIGTEFTSFAQVLSNYGFQPELGTYHYIDSVLDDAIDSTVQSQALDEYLVRLMKPLFTSIQYGITVLGGFFVSLAILAMLQNGSATFQDQLTHPAHGAGHTPLSHRRIQMAYRFGLGICLLLLTLLNIGGFWKNADLTGRAAPIYTFVSSDWYLPALFLITLSAVALDFALYLWKQRFTEPVTHTSLENSSAYVTASSLPREESTRSAGSRPRDEKRT